MCTAAPYMPVLQSAPEQLLQLESQLVCVHLCVSGASQSQLPPNQPSQLQLFFIVWQVCASLRARGAAGLRKGGKDRQGRREAHQPSQELPSHSRRRLRVSPTPPIVDACDQKGVASTSLCDGSLQPLAIESMARWTSTQPTVLVVPWHGRNASATRAVGAVASKVPRCFRHGPPSESFATRTSSRRTIFFLFFL